MAIGGAAVELDPARDTLVNVNAFGDPVPSARFMGGREFATLVHEGGEEPAARAIAGRAGDADPSDAVGAAGVRAVSDAQCRMDRRRADAAMRVMWRRPFYLAMMTATALELIGADGPTIVEGPFALNGLFVGMLAAATARPVIPAGGSATGTSIGAALLAAGEGASSPRRRFRKPAGHAAGARMGSLRGALARRGLGLNLTRYRRSRLAPAAASSRS